MSHRPGTCSAPVRTAESTRRPTAGRPGTRSSSSTTTPGSTTSCSIPPNSNTIYASSYQRRRSGCCFNGGGPGSAIWKSTDAGKTWTKLAEHGLPPGTYGRIALDVSRSNPNVVYAQIEAGETGTPERTPAVERGAATEATPAGAAAVTPPGAAGEAGRAGGAGQPAAAAAADESGSRWTAVDRRSIGATTAARPKAISPAGAAVAVARSAQQQPPPGWTPPALDPKKGGLLRSDNKGQSWTLISNCDARPMYFSQLRVDPMQRQDNLRRRFAGGEVARRRQDVRDARQRGRQRVSWSRRSARHLDRSEESEAHHDRQRRRARYQLGSGPYVGLRQHDGDGARLRRHRRHAASIFRVHRLAGQRQLGWSERDCAAAAAS